MPTGAYTCAQGLKELCCVGDVTMLYVGDVGLEEPGWLCKLPKHLLAHVRPWNPEVPVKALGDGNHNIRKMEDRN